MKTIRKVKDWELVKDELMGVTAFFNKSINFQTLWNTGVEAEEEIELINSMNDEEFLAYAKSFIPLPF